MSARFPRDGMAWAAAGIGIAATVLAWNVRFVQDDAFISFVYADALARGEGLTWFGDRVEGYSNFLWVLWSALGILVRAGPVAWSWVGGLAAFACALWCQWRLAGLVLHDPGARLFAFALFATNFSVFAYATGGLETMAVTALLLGCALHAVRLRAGAAPTRPGLLVLSAGMAALVLLRMDMLLPVFVLLLLVLEPLGAGLRDEPGGARLRGLAARLACLGGPFCVLVGAWLAWKWSWYGDPFPNSYYVKVRTGPAPVANGLRYVGRFLTWYALLPVAGGCALLAILRGRAEGLRKNLARVAVPLVLGGVWFGYLILVGGDFMEFRLLVPAAGFVACAVAACADAVATTPRGRRATFVAAIALLLAANARHALTFRGVTADRTLDSVDALSTFYGLYPDGDWSPVGAALRRELEETGVVIATSASGAIPYYGGLRTVDMCGVNDRYVALHGNRAGPEFARPGHRLAAPLRYLHERGVHLVVGHPLVTTRAAFSAPGAENAWNDVVLGMAFLHEIPVREATLVAMPLEADGRAGSDRVLVLWYLTPHPAVEAKLRSGRWLTRWVAVSE